MNNTRVLIVDEMHESIIPLLKDAGYDPVYLPMISRQGILEIIKDFGGLIIRSKTEVNKEILDAAPHLKFVARAGAGMDKVDQAYFESNGIVLINAPEGNRDALGEHTLGALLSLLHRITFSNDQIKQGIWDREANRGIELGGKVVGIYGVGYMGMSFARKLSGLGCQVVGYDKYKEDFSNDFIEQVSLADFKKHTEILSIHVPLKDDTQYLFDGDYLASFTSLKVVVNTARGEVLKTSDLIKMLRDGKLYGAVLDVLENEKLATYTNEEKELLKQLTDHPNVILTPHVGGWTYESYARINEVIVDKLKTSFPD